MKKPTTRRRIVTVRDVAKCADVSVGTVSRFLNGYSLRVENRNRIQRAIEELGYRENLIAKGLKTRRTLMVGVLLPKLDEFHISILTELEKISSQRGYILVVCDFESDMDVLGRKLSFLMDRNVDGIIASPIPGNLRALQEARNEGIPVVFFNDSLAGFETDHVSSDGGDAVRRATGYLINMNHRRIGLIIGSSQHSTAAVRFQGFESAHAEAELAIDRQLIREVNWGESSGGFRAAKSLLSVPDPPTAILSANYLIAVGVLRAVREMGLKVPRDISLLNFDDGDLFELSEPGITAIRQPLDEIGRASAEIMFRRLRGDWSDFPTDITVPAELILRDSVSRLSRGTG